jgi:hypothetical protein
MTDDWQEHEGTVVAFLALLFLALTFFRIPRYLHLVGVADVIVRVIFDVVGVLFALGSILAFITLLVSSASLRGVVRESWRFYIVRPVRVVFGRENPDFWASSVIVLIILGLPVALHYGVIVWLGASGLIELVVRVVAVLMFMFGVTLSAVVVSTLAVKPLFIEISSEGDEQQDIPARISRTLRRFIVTFVFGAEVITALVIAWQAEQWIIGLFQP